jgi:hypothetical protein
VSGNEWDKVDIKKKNEFLKKHFVKRETKSQLQMVL